MANWSSKINVRKVSANPIVKILNVIFAIVEFCTGIRRSGVLSEENESLVIDTSTKVGWFFLQSQDIMKISKSKISAVKVSTVKKYVIFRSTVVEIHASGVSEQVAYEVKVSYKEIKGKAESWLP